MKANELVDNKGNDEWTTSKEAQKAVTGGIKARELWYQGKRNKLKIHCCQMFLGRQQQTNHPVFMHCSLSHRTKQCLLCAW